MAFGIPGSESGGSADTEFLGRIQFDARSGFWKTVNRVNVGGRFENQETEPFKAQTLLMDFGSLHVGYSKIASPPVFMLVPMGQPFPPRPIEMVKDDNGKEKPAFSPSFRIKVMSAKTFGDSEARFFGSSAKTVMTAVEECWKAFCAAPEAAAGQVPVVNITTRVVEVQTPRGSSKFYAPVFTIAQWVDRPAALGDRSVPPPAAGGQPAVAAAPVAAAPAAAAPPPNHVPPPAAKPVAVEALPF